MSTNAFIGHVDEEGKFLARYVHWDGYPIHIGLALTMIIDRVGLLRTLDVLTHDSYGWSTIDPLIKPDDNGSGEVVTGFGRRYTDMEPTEWSSGRIGEKADPGYEWGYLFTGVDPDIAELVVVRVTEVYGRYEEVARVRVATLLDMAETHWAAIECGEKFERCKHLAWVHFPGIPESSQVSTADYLAGRRP